MKRSMLANEGLRRLLNMSPTLEWNESVEVMNEFAVKMSRSGYPASWREEAVKVSIQKYEAWSSTIRMERDLYSGLRTSWLRRENCPS